jgi:hypothetical protein
MIHFNGNSFFFHEFASNAERATSTSVKKYDEWIIEFYGNLSTKKQQTRPFACIIVILFSGSKILSWVERSTLPLFSTTNWILLLRVARNINKDPN